MKILCFATAVVVVLTAYSMRRAYVAERKAYDAEFKLKMPPRGHRECYPNTEDCVPGIEKNVVGTVAAIMLCSGGYVRNTQISGAKNGSVYRLYDLLPRSKPVQGADAIKVAHY